jgi:hypothetical protein
VLGLRIDGVNFLYLQHKLAPEHGASSDYFWKQGQRILSFKNDNTQFSHE